MVVFFCLIVVIGALLYFLTMSEFASVTYFRNLLKKSGYFDIDKIPLDFFIETIRRMLEDLHSNKGRRMLAKHEKETRVDRIDLMAQKYYMILIEKMYLNDPFCEHELKMIQKYNLQNAVLTKGK